MDIIFKGRRTEVQERFRNYALAKLGKIEKLDHKAIRVDVEISEERNPRQSDRRERVELTIRSRGPVIRAEASADDRYVAFDRALAKVEERMRRTGDRRKGARRGLPPASRIPGLGRIPGLRGMAAADGEPAAVAEDGTASLEDGGLPGGGLDGDGRDGGGRDGGARRGTGRGGRGRVRRGRRDGNGRAEDSGPAEDLADADEFPGADGRFDDVPDDGADPVVPIAMEGDGPLVVREKHHEAGPMTVDRALEAMELVGHDFYLFRDESCGLPSVVYRRHGYQYGLIRLVEQTRTEVVASPSVRQ